MNFPFFVGSLPFQSVPESIDFVKRHSTHLPFLPQLPEMNPQEDMIGQVLKGFELGFWDEHASSALELFQNEFVESPRFKIQVAGPLTVSKTLSLPFSEVLPRWQSLVSALIRQFRQGGFLGEMWIQVDEPFWSAENTLHKNLFVSLTILENAHKKTCFGIHSCATQRPKLNEEELKCFRFFSFDYSQSPIEIEEKAQMEEWLSQDPKRVLVWGGLNDPWDFRVRDSWVESHPQVWISASCGLYGQDPEKLKNLAR